MCWTVLATVVITHEKICKEHEGLTFTFEGHRPPLTLNGLAKIIVPYPKPCGHISQDCRPIADLLENILRLIF